MTQFLLPPSSDQEIPVPVKIPLKHQEDLGPISDTSPESWRYDPQRINHYYRQKPWQVLGRLLNITINFALFFFGLWWDQLLGNDPKRSKQRAQQLRELLTKLGPTYIKIGQALSTRPDLVPPVYLEELTTLQDQLPSFANEVAFQFIEEELGAPPREIFAQISEEPLAAASLGQVYQAQLKTGEKVAVKVQRPDLIRRITLDIFIMRNLAGWAKKKFKQIRSDLVGIIDEFSERIFEEMNYSQEGKNAEKFAHLYGYMKDIYIPKIYWEYTGRRVLTMEWIEGIKLTRIKEIENLGINATRIVEIGVECSLRQLLENGFFHADPHPGNLLAMYDGKLAYLDFGMMSNIKPHQRYGLIEAIVHLVNRDFEALAHDYVQLEFLTPETDLTPIVPALSDVFGNALGSSVAELNFKKITDQMSAMMYEFPFRVPAYYALIIRSMVTLEGIAISIDPEFKVLSKAYPYVAKRLLTDPALELRNSLKDLLFKDGSFRWNRLENLLHNAKSSPDYNIEKVLNQAIEFIFSERGVLIRENLINEIIQSIDLFGRRTWHDLSSRVLKQVGFVIEEKQPEFNQNSESFKHLQNIWTILQTTPGFDPLSLLPLIPQLLAKDETKDMGQKIAEGLVQKVAARLIRNILLEEENKSEISPPNNLIKLEKAPLPKAAFR